MSKNNDFVKIKKRTIMIAVLAVAGLAIILTTYSAGMLSVVAVAKPSSGGGSKNGCQSGSDCASGKVCSNHECKVPNPGHCKKAGETFPFCGRIAAPKDDLSGCLVECNIVAPQGGDAWVKCLTSCLNRPA